MAGVKEYVFLGQGTLNKTSTTLTVGESERLDATAVSTGEATITVTTVDGGKTANCIVTVNKNGGGGSSSGDNGSSGGGCHSCHAQSRPELF